MTGIQSIDNKLYYFDANGVKRDATFGIDVSKYQASVDFEKVKEAGAKFVIIRLGYRGYGSGTLVQGHPSSRSTSPTRGTPVCGVEGRLLFHTGRQ